MTEERKLQIDITYMSIAKEIAKLSYCQKRKVGSIIVKNRQIISEGYNGTPAGRPNICEVISASFDRSKPAEVFPGIKGKLVTKSEVLHAESNAITKCAKFGNSTDGATIYVTCSPCIECSKLIIQAGITRVIYLIEHDTDGLDLMKSVGISCEMLVVENDKFKLIEYGKV